MTLEIAGPQPKLDIGPIRAELDAFKGYAGEPRDCALGAALRQHDGAMRSRTGMGAVIMPERLVRRLLDLAEQSLDRAIDQSRDN